VGKRGITARTHNVGGGAAGVPGPGEGSITQRRQVGILQRLTTPKDSDCNGVRGGGDLIR